MLVIRLFRVGKKNQPAFKIVVTDKRKSATKGVYVEEVGFWNPLTKEKILKQERIKYWLSVGAKPSATVHNLLISEKIIEGEKIPVHKKKKIKEGSAEAEGATASQEGKPLQEKPKIEPPKKETPAKTESSPIPEKKEPPEEDKSSSRPSPSEEGSVKEEPKTETLEEETPAQPEAKPIEEEIPKEDKSQEENPQTENPPEVLPEEEKNK